MEQQEHPRTGLAAHCAPPGRADNFEMLNPSPNEISFPCYFCENGDSDDWSNPKCADCWHNGERK